MIVKSLSRRSGSTSQLLKYILRYVLEKEQLRGKGKDPKEKPFLVRHNFRSRSINGYIKELEKLEELREHRYANNVSVYHYILSFSSQDKQQITDELLKDIAEHFITLRGEDNLYIGTKHIDKDHIHMHIAMSAVDLAGRSVRITKKDFETLKKDLDAYQREHYPELKHSLPDHGKKSRGLTREAIAAQVKSSRTTEKQDVLKAIESAFAKSRSVDAFLSELTDQGYTPYLRGGKVTGITTPTERKYRFSTLGYNKEKLEELSVLQEQDKELAALRALREQPSRPRSILQATKQEEIAPTLTSPELAELAAIREAAGSQRGRDITSPEPKPDDNLSEKEPDEREATETSKADETIERNTDSDRSDREESNTIER